MGDNTITVGNPHFADETMYCPNCGIQIDYVNRPPNYCPSCGSKIEVEL